VPPPLDPAVLAAETEKRMAKIAAAVEKMKAQEALDGAIKEAEESQPPYTYEPKRPDDSVLVALDASHKQLAVALTKFLNEEFKAMPEDARRMVLVLWPPNVMKFKAAREAEYTYTLMELEAIEKVIADISAQNGLPFPIEPRPGLVAPPKTADVVDKAEKAGAKKRGRPAKKVEQTNNCIICGKPTDEIDSEKNPCHSACNP
jgi:hypothetical protein